MFLFRFLLNKIVYKFIWVYLFFKIIITFVSVYIQTLEYEVIDNQKITSLLLIYLTFGVSQQ